MINISILYPDLDNKFPIEVDDFERFIDPDISSLQAINRYYQYFDSGDLASATSVLAENPNLKRMIINAESMNKLRDGLISVERYYLNDIQQYLVEIVKYKGFWSNGTRYTKYDVVYYESNGAIEVYMGISTTIPIGTLPTDITYWIPLVIRGEKGDAGIGLAFQGEYDISKTYQKNDAVQYLGNLYGALKESTGVLPTVGGSNEYWALAWNFKIPNNYISYSMLDTNLKNTITTAAYIKDDVNGATYRFGAENGAIYIEEIV